MDSKSTDYKNDMNMISDSEIVEALNRKGGVTMSSEGQPQRVCTIMSFDGVSMHPWLIMLNIQDWCHLVRLVMSSSEYTVNGIAACVTGGAPRLLQMYPLLAKESCVSVPLAEQIASELHHFDPESDEICIGCDAEGNCRHLVARVEDDFIEIHCETVIAGEIEQKGSLVIGSRKQFSDRTGVYLPTSILRVLTKWCGCGEVSFDGIIRFLDSKKIDYTYA